MDLSKITDQKLIDRLCEIASKDGGKNKSEIDSDKGLRELGNLLGGNFYRDLTDVEQNVILGLCVDCQAKQNTSNNVTNTGDGVSVGNIGSNSNVIIGNNNQIIINEGSQKPKYKISDNARLNGEKLANALYEETVEDLYADNGKIVGIIGCLNNKNAYSFFKEYARLNNENEIMQNIYNVSDIFQRISLEQTYQMLNALLSQAENIGLQNDESYTYLIGYLESIKNKTNKDPTTNETINIDYRIKFLLEKMSEVYGNK